MPSQFDCIGAIGNSIRKILHRRVEMRYVGEHRKRSTISTVWTTTPGTGAEIESPHYYILSTKRGWGVKNIFNILTTTCLENDSNAIHAMSHRSDNITTKRIHDSMSDVSYIVRRQPNRPKKMCCTSHDHAPYTTFTTSVSGPRVPDLTNRQITPRK